MVYIIYLYHSFPVLSTLKIFYTFTHFTFINRLLHNAGTVAKCSVSSIKDSLGCGLEEPGIEPPTFMFLNRKKDFYHKKISSACS